MKRLEAVWVYSCTQLGPGSDCQIRRSVNAKRSRLLHENVLAWWLVAPASLHLPAPARPCLHGSTNTHHLVCTLHLSLSLLLPRPLRCCVWPPKYTSAPRHTDPTIFALPNIRFPYRGQSQTAVGLPTPRTIRLQTTTRPRDPFSHIQATCIYEGALKLCWQPACCSSLWSAPST